MKKVYNIIDTACMYAFLWPMFLAGYIEDLEKKRHDEGLERKWRNGEI